MAAHTLSQLETILGYVVEEGGDTFAARMRQVLPRMNDMGLWRDMAYEVSMSGELGYISLPSETDAVLACTINNFARNTRSLWHDVKIVGRTATLSGYFGIVDAGFFPVLLDMEDVQEEVTADLVPVTTFSTRHTGTSTAASVSGQTTIEGLTATGQRVTLTQSGSTFTASPGIVKITSIAYDETSDVVDLIDPNFPTKIIATIPAGSGVVRFRRFRTSNKDASTVVHLLVKRGCPDQLLDSTVIHLGNVGALKHALLALIAEDSSDIERSSAHWGMCGKLLDQELASMFGSAKPSLRISDPAAGGIYNNY